MFICIIFKILHKQTKDLPGSDLSGWQALSVCIKELICVCTQCSINCLRSICDFFFSPFDILGRNLVFSGYLFFLENLERFKMIFIYPNHV